MDYYLGALDCFFGNAAEYGQTEEYYKGYNDQYQLEQIQSRES